MSAQRPLSALIAGLLLSFVLAAAMVFAARGLAVPTAMVAMSLIATLLAVVLAGSVILIVVGGNRAPRRDHGR